MDAQIRYAHKGMVQYSHKKNGKEHSIRKITFIHVNSHPYTTSQYPIPKEDPDIYIVKVTLVQKGEESPYYGTLDEGIFKHIYPTIHGTKICYPYDVRHMIRNLQLVEIGKIDGEMVNKRQVWEINWEETIKEIENEEYRKEVIEHIQKYHKRKL
jgi:hypothetical protein